MYIHGDFMTGYMVVMNHEVSNSNLREVSLNEPTISFALYDHIDVRLKSKSKASFYHK